MNKKVAITYGIVIVVVFAIGFIFGGRQTNIAGAPTTTDQGQGTSTATTTTSLPVSIVAVHDATAPLYRLSIEYPQFPSAPASFNTSIKNFVDNDLAQFKTNIQENWTARQATTPSGTAASALSQIYYFDVSWDPAQLNSHYISLIVRIAAFEGGANEDDEIMTFNYDLSKNATVSLADLFPGNTNYLSTVSQLASQELTSSLNSTSNGNAPADMIEQGTAPTVANFANFVFNDDVITLYFPKGQVAPADFGEQQLVIVRSSL